MSRSAEELLLQQAYLTNNPKRQLVEKDFPHFIVIAKRIAVYFHFEKMKAKQIATIYLH